MERWTLRWSCCESWRGSAVVWPRSRCRTDSQSQLGSPSAVSTCPLLHLSQRSSLDHLLSDTSRKGEYNFDNKTWQLYKSYNSTMLTEKLYCFINFLYTFLPPFALLSPCKGCIVSFHNDDDDDKFYTVHDHDISLRTVPTYDQWNPLIKPFSQWNWSLQLSLHLSQTRSSPH